ncbi:VTC domain-containing protein [Chloroflexota bacterium]
MSTVRGVLELKQKLGRQGWKETLPLDQTFNLTSNTWSQIMALLADSVNAVFGEYLAVSWPTLINNYMREYYESADGTTRLTLDYKLTTYNQRLSSQPNLRFQTPSLNIIIIEIKSNIHNSMRLADLLARFPLRVERYSKYVEAMNAISGW